MGRTFLYYIRCIAPKLLKQVYEGAFRRIQKSSSFKGSTCKLQVWTAIWAFVF